MLSHFARIGHVTTSPFTSPYLIPHILIQTSTPAALHLEWNSRILFEILVGGNWPTYKNHTLQIVSPYNQWFRLWVVSQAVIVLKLFCHLRNQDEFNNTIFTKTHQDAYAALSCIISYHAAETAYHGAYKHTPKKHSIPSELSWKKDKFIKKMSLDCNLSLVDIVSDL